MHIENCCLEKVSPFKHGCLRYLLFKFRGERLDDAHPFPGPTHSTGGGGLMGYDHDHGRGGGRGTRNLELIYTILY